MQLRRAYLKNGLQLNPSLQSLSALYDAVSRITLRGEADKSTNTISTSGAEIGAEEDESLVVEFTRRAAVGYVAATRSPAETFAQVQVQVSLARPELNMEIASLPVYRSSARLALRHTDYAEWQWPFLLNRYVKVATNRALLVGLPCGAHSKLSLAFLCVVRGTLTPCPCGGFLSR